MEIARANVDAELEPHHADCFAWAMACCGRDRADAEDVLQRSYLKVLDGRAVFASRSTRIKNLLEPRQQDTLAVLRTSKR